VIAKLWVGLALSVHNLLDVVAQGWQAHFGGFPPKKVQTLFTGTPDFELVGSLAEGFAVPSQFVLSQPLPIAPQFGNGAGYEQTPRTALERFGSFDEQRFETIGEFQWSIPA